jgi:N-glycosylase/DNA lyase
MWKALLDKSGKNINNSVLNLKNTLMNGQSFNWKIVENKNIDNKNDNNNYNQEFIGYIGNLVFVMTEKLIHKEKEKNEINHLSISISNERIILYKLLNKEQLINKKFDMLQYLTRNKFTIIHYKNLKDFIEQKEKNNFIKEKEIEKKEEKNNNENGNGNEINQKEYEIKIETFLNNLLLDYFQMEVNMPKILDNLSDKLPSNMLNVIRNLEGVRIVKQDVFECTISFICSSNNNIERIKKMLNTLRENYGEIILNDDNKNNDNKRYGKIYAFPTIINLKKNLNENILRELGYGYRAKYIINSLELIENQGEDWLYELNDKENIWEELIKLNGVGRKVADCISLFSLRKHQIVPLDIHMIKFYNETIRKLDKKYAKIENLTKNVYEKVSNIYSETFGEYAGWVHSVFYLNRVDKERPDYLNENKLDLDLNFSNRNYNSNFKTKSNSKSKSKIKSKSGKRNEIDFDENISENEKEVEVENKIILLSKKKKK